MKLVLGLWPLMFFVLASWIHRPQQEVIDYLLTENAVFNEKVGKRQILLTDGQRHRSVVKVGDYGEESSPLSVLPRAWFR